MERSKIQKRVNELLAGETLSYFEMRPFLDQAVDDINHQLNTIFPAFSELDDNILEYTAIPDRYIRTVVCIGAAVYFYKMDEEGGQAPPGYERDYQTNLFLMLRDYLPLVPPQYIGNLHQGVYDFSLDGELANLENPYGIRYEDMQI